MNDEYEAKLARDRHVIEKVGDVSREIAVAPITETFVTDRGAITGLGITPNNYERLMAEKKGLDYFRELSARYDTWAEVKFGLDIDMFCDIYDLTKNDLKELWKKDKDLAEEEHGKIKLSWGMERKSKENGDTSLRLAFLELLKDKEYSKSSELLADYVKQRLHIYTTKDDKASEMWVYKDGVYVPHGRSEVREILRQGLGDIYSTYHFNQAIAKIEADTFIEPKKFFQISDIDELPVLNGLLNLRTRELTPFTHERIHFSKLPALYDPEASCEAIDRFLKEVLPDESDIQVIYEIGGFSLWKDYTFEKAFMFVGDGRNGKGKTLELFKMVLGGDNCQALPLNSLRADNPDVSELFGKHINLAGDIASTDLKDTTMFKSLTGRDLITAKRKFLSTISFYNFAKMVFACNQLPMVYDPSIGFWDRWILIEFPYTFVTKEEYDNSDNKEKLKVRDEQIIQKISTPDQLSGLLNRFLDGLQRLFENHSFSTSKGTEEVKDTWIRKSNSFIAFCTRELKEDSDGVITKKELRKRYADYCKLHKVPTKSDYVVKRVLQEFFGAGEERRNFSTFGKIDDYQWCWTGVNWS